MQLSQNGGDVITPWDAYFCILISESQSSNTYDQSTPWHTSKSTIKQKSKLNTCKSHYNEGNCV